MFSLLVLSFLACIASSNPQFLDFIMTDPLDVELVEVACPDPWVRFGHDCYWASDFTVPWDSVEAACEFAHPSAAPASVHSQLENAALDTLLNRTTAWLGLSRLNVSSHFYWSDGTQVDFTYWDQRQPSNNGDCGVINANNATGQWAAVSCHQEHLFTCKFQLDACPDGWLRRNDSCYLYHSEPLHPQLVDDACRAIHPYATSASIHSIYVNDFLLSMVYSEMTWIGLYRPENSPWQWQDGSDLDYELWAYTPPSNDTYAYMDVGSNGSWVSTDLDYDLAFFCELAVWL